MSADFERVVDEIKDVLYQSASDAAVSPSDLRDILSFLTKVTQVVDQSFQDVYTLAIELSYVTLADLTSGRIKRLQQGLDLLVGHSHYREAEEICSRLKHLRIRFEDFVKPAVSHLSTERDWSSLFWLIEEREGRIIMLVNQATWEMRQQIEELSNRKRPTENSVKQINRSARKLVDELRPLIGDLRNLTNEILGLSGRPGFLELTEDRRQLSRAASIVVNKGALYMSRDTFNVQQAGAVGPHASATNTTFNQVAAQLAANFDMRQLGDQLQQLRQEMLKNATDADHYASVAAVAKAEEATKINDTSTLFASLKSAGRWALDTATKIGVSVAAKAIEGAIGA